MCILHSPLGRSYLKIDLVSWSGKHGHLPQSEHSQIMVNHGYNRPESKSERTT